MELGLFQLENLFQNPNRFLFLDLRHDPGAVNGALGALMARARKVSPDQVLAVLSGEQVPTEHPIVLVCEDGHASSQMEQQLEAAGYQQIYVVTGGVAGLLSEG